MADRTPPVMFLDKEDFDEDREIVEAFRTRADAGRHGVREAARYVHADVYDEAIKALKLVMKDCAEIDPQLGLMLEGIGVRTYEAVWNALAKAKESA